MEVSCGMQTNSRPYFWCIFCRVLTPKILLTNLFLNKLMLFYKQYLQHQRWFRWLWYTIHTAIYQRKFHLKIVSTYFVFNFGKCVVQFKKKKGNYRCVYFNFEGLKLTNIRVRFFKIDHCDSNCHVQWWYYILGIRICAKTGLASARSRLKRAKWSFCLLQK